MSCRSCMSCMSCVSCVSCMSCHGSLLWNFSSERGRTLWFTPKGIEGVWGSRAVDSRVTSALELDSRCSLRPLFESLTTYVSLLLVGIPLLSLQSQPTFAIGGWVLKSIPHSSRFWDTPFHTVNLQCPVQGKRQKSFKFDSFWCVFKAFKSIPHSSHFWDTPSWQKLVLSQNLSLAAARDHFFKKMQVRLVFDLGTLATCPISIRSTKNKVWWHLSVVKW